MDPSWIVLGALTVIAVIAVFVVWKMFFRVDEGSLAVVTRFGAARRRTGDQQQKLLMTCGPGLHMKAPWDRVRLVSMKEQSLELSGELGGRTAMAADGTLLRFDSILRFVPVEERLDDYLFGMKQPEEHITGLFTCLLRNEIANFGGDAGAKTATTTERTALAISHEPRSRLDGPASLGADPGVADMGSFALIRRERGRLNGEIAGFCHTQIGDRHGLKFNAVDLVDILPPDELAEALNAVMNARTEAGAMYFRAEGECQQRVLAAEQGVQIARSRARAIETEIEVLGGVLGTLETDHTLEHYVARRRDEVLAEARTVYVKENA
jgi:regulator of protease activity HflC (stomatin/prohibitin superfamily)